MLYPSRRSHSFRPLLLAAAALLAAPVRAQAPAAPLAAPAPPPPPVVAPEGRAAATFQTAPDDTTGTPFEPNRIKRTAQMLPKTALTDGGWDLLYNVGAGTPKSAYFDWDADNIYLAWESPIAEPVRFDIDGADDGFLHGADNLRVFVDTPATIDADATALSVPVSAELWDNTAAGGQPARRPAPIPPGAVKAVAAKTARGTYAIMVSIGRSELFGLPRTPGHPVGLRIETGAQPASTDGSLVLSGKPFIHLLLATRVPAQAAPVRVTLDIGNDKPLVSGDPLRAVLQITNTGNAPVTLTSLFVRGSGASQPFVDTAAFLPVSLAPRASTKREIKTAVSTATLPGTQVITGGAQWTVAGATDSTPATTAALASFDRAQPYFVQMDTDKKPVQTSPERSVGAITSLTVTVGSRTPAAQNAAVSLKLPPGWGVEGSEGTDRTVALKARGSNTLRYRVQVPASTTPGQYVVEASAHIGDAEYSSAQTITVAAAPAPAAAKKP